MLKLGEVVEFVSTYWMVGLLLLIIFLFVLEATQEAVNAPTGNFTA